MVQPTTEAPRTTTTTAGNIADRDIVIHRGDHDRPYSRTSTTFGGLIKEKHQPLRLHQRTPYRSYPVHTYDDNQVSSKSSKGLRFENYDLLYLHKGTRWSQYHSRQVQGSRTSQYLIYEPRAHLLESPRKLWHSTAAMKAISGKDKGAQLSHQDLLPMTSQGDENPRH